MKIIRSGGFTTAVLLGASVLVGTLFATAALAQEGREDWTAYLPPGTAKLLVAERCTVCHDLGAVVTLRKSHAGWQALLTEMIDLGAPLMAEEEEQIALYLGLVFGPDAPRITDVNIAGQEELIKLPGVTPALATKLVGHRKARGPFSSRDDVRPVLGLDDDSFEKIKWYLRAIGGSSAR